jgi:hypothetical protein
MPKKKMKKLSDQQRPKVKRNRDEADSPGLGLSEPVKAIEAKHRDLAQRLGARDDLYSQTVAKSFVDEHAGVELLTRSGLTPKERDELAEMAPEAHRLFQQQSAEAIGRLRRLLSECDPLYVVAYMKASNLLASEGSYFEPTHEGRESSVELVAGLVLTQPAPAPASATRDETLVAIVDTIGRLDDLALLRNLSAPRDDDLATAALRFSSALGWMTLRGSSYEHHGQELARAVYEPHDAWSLERFGFTIDDVLRVGRAADDLTAERLNALLAEAATFAARVEATVGTAEFQEQLDPDRREQFELPEARQALARRAFGDVFARGITDHMTFTADDLVDVGLPSARVNAVLAEMSCSVGSLGPDDYNGLFDKSPLVERPFLAHNGRYLLVVPGMLLRDTVAVLEGRYLRERNSYSKSRATTLDTLAVGHLASLLPGAQAFTNLFYEQFELDGLVIFESIAFVVEGKAKPVSVQGKRGDLTRLTRDIAQSVEEAMKQGARAAEYIRGEQDAVFVDERGNEVVRLATGAIETIVIVNPTLHELAGHATQLPRLRALGLFGDGQYPWSIFINDLRVIAETCDNSAVFLHYLRWRARLPLGDRVTVTDELDLWGSYLLNERFGALADGGDYIVGNSSTDFDAYYDGVLGNGPAAPKPRKFLHEPITSFVAAMARDRLDGWLDAASVCLDLSVPELAFVCGMARRTWRKANREGIPIVTQAGRIQLVGMPRGMTVSNVRDGLVGSGDAEVTFRIFVRGSKARKGEVAWAEQLRPVGFELSDFERAATEASITESLVRRERLDMPES